MTIKTVKAGGVGIAIVTSGEICLFNAQTALDFMMSVQSETGCNRIVLSKETLIEDFFVLSTKVAGDILQKFVNYGFKLAVVGDFSGYASRPLKDFIYESNQGRDIFFVSSKEEAVQRLSRA